ncbi:10474_t:CDS:2, partial [Scutellospora calospora]
KVDTRYLLTAYSMSYPLDPELCDYCKLLFDNNGVVLVCVIPEVEEQLDISSRLAVQLEQID